MTYCHLIPRRWFDRFEIEGKKKRGSARGALTALKDVARGRSALLEHFHSRRRIKLQKADVPEHPVLLAIFRNQLFFVEAFVTDLVVVATSEKNGQILIDRLLLKNERSSAQTFFNQAADGIKVIAVWLADPEVRAASALTAEHVRSERNLNGLIAQSAGDMCIFLLI